MKIFTFYYAKYGATRTQKALASLVGVCPETVSRWKNIEGYERLFNEEVAQLRQPIHDRLEMVALRNIENPKIWQLMAEKHGFLKRKSRR